VAGGAGSFALVEGGGFARFGPQAGAVAGGAGHSSEAAALAAWLKGKGVLESSYLTLAHESRRCPVPLAARFTTEASRTNRHGGQKEEFPPRQFPRDLHGLFPW
jgi:hypothetical protein